MRSRDLRGVGKRATNTPIIIAVTDKALRDELSRMNATDNGDLDIDPFYGAAGSAGSTG